MTIDLDDFSLTYKRKDGIPHTVDYDDLIKAYEELKQLRNQQTEAEICRKFAERLKQGLYSLQSKGFEQYYIKDELKWIDEVLAEMEQES